MSEAFLTTTDNCSELLLERQLCFPLYAAARRMVNSYTPCLKPLGLTYTQYIVFLCLWEHGETTMGELCSRLYLDNGTLTPMIKRMERDGYVSRTRSPEDERVVKIRLTDRGWDLREQARDIPEKVGSSCCLKQEDASALYALLHRLLGCEGNQDYPDMK